MFHQLLSGNFICNRFNLNTGGGLQSLIFLILYVKSYVFVHKSSCEHYNTFLTLSVQADWLGPPQAL